LLDDSEKPACQELEGNDVVLPYAVEPIRVRSTVDPELAEGIVHHPSRACTSREGDDVSREKVIGRVVVHLEARLAGQYEQCLAGFKSHVDGGMRCCARPPETNLKSVIYMEHVHHATRLVIVLPSDRVDV
jgi:hypothetical protein